MIKKLLLLIFTAPIIYFLLINKPQPKTSTSIPKTSPDMDIAKILDDDSFYTTPNIYSFYLLLLSPQPTFDFAKTKLALSQLEVVDLNFIIFAEICSSFFKITRDAFYISAIENKQKHVDQFSLLGILLNIFLIELKEQTITKVKTKYLEELKKIDRYTPHLDSIFLYTCLKFFQLTSDVEVFQLISKQHNKQIDENQIKLANKIFLRQLFLILEKLTAMSWSNKITFNIDSFLKSKNPKTNVIYPYYLALLHNQSAAFQEIFIVSDRNDAVKAHLFSHTIRKKHIPNSIILEINKKNQFEELTKYIPALSGKKAINNKATVFFCKNHICHFPIQTIEKLRIFLSKI